MKGVTMRVKGLCKLWILLFSLPVICGCAADVVIAPPPQKRLPPPPKILPGDLQVLHLEMVPDPVREGEPVQFRMTLANSSPYSGGVSLFLKDRDESAAVAYDVPIRPGQNRIEFPPTGYRFHQGDPCFFVEADIERTRRPVELARSFCAWKTQGGWTLTVARIGPFIVENLEMYPDPIYDREEAHFKVKVKNEGRPVRGSLWIQDGDQIVSRLEDVHLRHGYGEYQFPYSRYVFHREDHCFVVFIDVEKKDQRVDAQRRFCVQPVSKGRGWTLRP
jgi:hypothetical protein